MKVGIIGNYGNNNNGDEAILTGILHQLTEHLHVKKEDIVVFSNNPENTIERYGITAKPLIHKKGSILKSGATTIQASYRVMKKLDLLIIGGGGLLMDMYKRDAPLYSTLGLTGKRAGCKVVVYGVGAGPLNTALGKFFIKRLTNAAASVSVRDTDSQKLLQSIGVKTPVAVIGDPAFSVPAEKTHKPSASIKKVGVTAVPYFSNQYWPTPDLAKYDAYVNGMASQLDQLIEKQNVEVTFFSTKFPEDVQVTKDILAKMKHSASLMEDNLHPVDIVKLSAEQDLIIGTRLHSLILSVVAKTPVIGIGYHHKVEDFMKVIGMPTLGIPIQQVTPDSSAIVNVFHGVSENWESVQQAVEKVSEHLKKEALKGLKQLDLDKK
ncbi:polysaccharide pyruvyl transferase family protein [Alkalihalobacillus sp. MEB130]|uniref:polysaccharide pyruvyl transferase family protein n=1 Tax=Alkalihalobacillus sp. MEB130 TaxID=2976704 RepID=UPI0028DFEA57|nr:polysaccharide pyruvyl transferase family protein [Alkalihalobacillus sp. MEB130]MDT8858817.1 polysaccharide pyruvyl transferase family protein [Alkalihalobacillus sp. MEB130]